MHHDDQGHDALRHYAVLKGLKPLKNKLVSHHRAHHKICDMVKTFLSHFFLKHIFDEEQVNNAQILAYLVSK